MAVDFKEKRKKQKYLILVVAGILIVIGVILYFGYFKKSDELIVPGPAFTPKKDIKINYETLENPVLDQLESFPKTMDYKGELGKSNPFLPH